MGKGKKYRLPGGYSQNAAAEGEGPVARLAETKRIQIRKNPYVKQLKRQITIRLDASAVEYFQALAGELGIFGNARLGRADRCFSRLNLRSRYLESMIKVGVRPAEEEKAVELAALTQLEQPATFPRNTCG